MTSIVPRDMWICGECRNGNLIELTDNKCPACGHTRDDCCIGPGGTYSTSSSVTTNPVQPPDTWYCDQCGALNQDWYDTCGQCQQYRPQDSALNQGRYDPCGQCQEYRSQAGAGSPAPGAWVCQYCGSANSDLTSDFCPACGRYR